MRSRNVTIWAMALAVLLIELSDAAAAIIFNDGLTHTIDYQLNNYDGVYVGDSQYGYPTTVNLVAGGSISPGVGPDKDVYVSGHSYVNVYGGYIGGSLIASNNSQVSVSGGEIKDSLAANAYAQVNVSGGKMLGAYTESYSELTISGGEIGRVGFTLGVGAYGFSHITITGGNFASMISADWDSIIDIYGVSSNFPGIWVIKNGLITLYGTDFNTGYGEIRPYNQDRLTGKLSNGQQINVGLVWDGYDPGRIVTAIPEPATILLLGLGAMLLRKRTQLNRPVDSARAAAKQDLGPFRAEFS